jgi:rhodanese-related sulfurtransferase
MNESARSMFAVAGRHGAFVMAAFCALAWIGAAPSQAQAQAQTTAVADVATTAPPAAATAVPASVAAPATAAPSATAAPTAAEIAAILATVPTVTPDALLQRRSQPDPSLLLLDVRTPEEFAAGHVPGARNLSHDQLAAHLDELQAAKDAGQEIVVYCRSGRRAASALQVLRAAGFRKLAHLEGDYQGWDAAGRAVAR